MADARRSDHSAPTNELPDEIYIGFVDGLLTDILPVVLLSAVAVTCGEIAAAVAAKSLILGAAAPAQLLIALVRLHFARRHARNIPSPTVEIARKRERVFSAGALVSLTALSSWTLLAFCVTDNNFAHFLGVSMTTAYAFSLMSRSYAIYRGVNLQLFGAFAPLSIAMIIAGGWYPVGIAVGIAPLVLYMKSYAKRLRDNFMAVVASQQQAAMLAARLDMALNNMSHGLCMLTPDGRLVLTNDQALKMFGLQPDDAPVGAHVKSVLAKLVGAGILAELQFARLASILANDRSGVDFVIPLETLDDRAFEITVHRMTSEGTVLVVQDVTERRNAQLEINRMARFDSVTELPNRRNFEEQLALALRRDDAPGDGLTVMFLDLDDFKQVNDSLGHRTGDKLLVEIASRLRAIIGPRDLVARWGGDEFVILQHHEPGQLETEALAKLLIDEINRAVVIDGSEVIVGASIGSASAPDE